jgi:hypothetical protein
MAVGPTTREAKTTFVIIFALVAATWIAIYVSRFPPKPPGNLPFLVAPEPAKLLELAALLGWLLALNLAAFQAGELVRRLMPRAGSRPEIRWVFSLGIGFAVLGVGVLLLAMLGLLDRVVLSVATCALGLTFVARIPKLLRQRRPRSPGGWRRSVVLGLAATIALALPLLDALGPDPGFDAAMYHLAVPERYLFENGVAMTPFSHLYAYAFNTEMIYTLALGTAGPRLAPLLHFEFGVLTLIVLFFVGRRLSPRAALLAPAILLADPLFVLEMGWANNDLALGFYALLATVCLADWLASPALDRGPPIYAAVFGGLCCSTRYLGVLIPIAMGVAVLVLAKRDSLGFRLRAGAVIAAAAIVAPLPFLVRNLVLTGNPIAPILQSLFYAPGAEYFDPVVIEQNQTIMSSIGMGRDLWAFLGVPWNLTMESTPGSFGNSFGFQVGSLYAICAAAGLLVLRVRRSPFLKAVMFLAGLQVILWFLSLQEARYLIPTFPLLALAGAAGIAHLMEGARWRRSLYLLPAFCIAYCIAMRLPGADIEYGYALGGIDDEMLRTRHFEAHAAAFLRKTTKKTDKVMLFFEPLGFNYRGIDYIPYHVEFGSRVMRFVQQQDSLESMHCALRQLGVTHILINRDRLASTSPTFVPSYGELDYQRGLERIGRYQGIYTRRIYASSRIWIGRLRPSPHCSPTRVSG